MEDLLRLRWKPTLNADDKPYYLLKDTYARDFRELKKTRARGKAPWQGGGGRPPPMSDGTRRTVTQYDTEDHTVLGEPRKGHGSAYNLAKLCEASEGSTMVSPSLKVRLAQPDLSSFWAATQCFWPTGGTRA